jgi:hypothetical protein
MTLKEKIWENGVFILPEIPYPAHQEEGGVPEGDERVLAEEDRLRSHRRLCELREDDSRHASLRKKSTSSFIRPMGERKVRLDQ